MRVQTFALCIMRPDGDRVLAVASTGLLKDYYALQCAEAEVQMSLSWNASGHLGYKIMSLGDIRTMHL